MRRPVDRGRRKLGRRLLVLAGIIVVGLLLFAGPSGLVRIISLELRARHLRAEIAALKARQELVNQRRWRLEHDTAYLRRLAAARYHLFDAAPETTHVRDSSAR